MMHRKKAQIKIKKTLVVVAMLVACLLFSGGRAQAGYWAENFAANIMQIAIEEAREIFEKMILTSLKKAAGTAIIDQMKDLAAGTSGQPGVVADYEDFIYGTTQRHVDKYVTDFFRVMQTGGVSSETRDEFRMVETAIRNELAPSMPKDLFEYRIDSPEPRKDVLNQAVGGGKEEYLAMQMSGVSHPVDVFFLANDAITAKMEQEQEAQKAKVIAGGGFDTIVSGSKVVPGAVMKDLLVAAESMPIEMINNAGSWQEVISTMAVQALSSFVQNGINVVSRPIENQIRRIQRTTDEGINGVLQDVYSGIDY